MKILIRIVFIVIIGFCFIQGQGQNMYTLKFALEADSDNEFLSVYENFSADSIGILSKLHDLIGEAQLKGYWSASVDSIRFDSVNVYAHFFLGRKYAWGAIDYSVLEDRVIKALDIKPIKKKRDLLNVESLEKRRKGVLEYFENSGYPFTQVYFDSICLTDSFVSASLAVKTGDVYRIDSVIVKGDAKISDVYIKKSIQIDGSDLFNQEKINNIDHQISNIRFLSVIKPAEIEFKQDGVDLYIYLQNKKANMFNGIIGFLPESEESGKLLITGDLKLDLVNSFGRGEELFLKWEKLESSTQSLDVGMSYPYLFKSNLGIDVSFGLYKKDSTYLSLKTDLGLKLFLENSSYIKGYYRFKSSSKIGEEEVFVSSTDYADVKSNIFGAAYYLNTLNYNLNPRKGVELSLLGGAGVKNITNSNLIDSLAIDDKTIEVEAELDLNLYFPIYNNFIFHFGNRTRYMDQFSDEETLFFENELYRFGGAKTLRGFDESIFYASVYSLQNVEIKYLFEQNSSFYLFWNGAYYYQNTSVGVVEDFPWGVGVGMDFDTKAGIFSLSYALGKQFDNPLEIRTAKIHFGYISRF